MSLYSDIQNARAAAVLFYSIMKGGPTTDVNLSSIGGGTVPSLAKAFSALPFVAGNGISINGGTHAISVDTSVVANLTGAQALSNKSVAFADGSAAAPSASWETNNGFFWDATNSAIGASWGGAQHFFFNASEMRYWSTGTTVINRLQGQSGTMFVAERYVGSSGSAVNSLRKARGTIAAPALPITGDTLGIFRFEGWTDTTNFGTGADIRGIVTEPAWSSGTLGTYLSLRVCPNGSAVLSEIAALDFAAGVTFLGAAFPSIDTDMALRTRSATITGVPASGHFGRLFFITNGQGGAGEMVTDDGGTGLRHMGQAAVKKLTTDANFSYTAIVDGRILRDTATLTADRNLILTTANVTDGYKITLSRRGSSGGHNRAVYQANGTTLIANVADGAKEDFAYDAVAALWFQL